MSFVEVEKCLGEGEKEDPINYGKCQHVPSYHGVNHRHKGTRQLYGAERKDNK